MQKRFVLENVMKSMNEMKSISVQTVFYFDSPPLSGGDLRAVMYGNRRKQKQPLKSSMAFNMQSWNNVLCE